MKDMIKDEMAERSVLGAAIFDNKIIENLDLEADDFYSEANKIIYSAILKLNNKGAGTDLVSLQDELLKQNKLNDIGNIGYLIQLSNSAPIHANVLHHSTIIKKCAKLRKIYSAAEKAMLLCCSNAEPDEIIDGLKIDNIGCSDKVEIENIMDVFKKNHDEMEKKLKESYAGIPTKFCGLDRVLGGLQKGKLYVLAGRPGMGKTALALNIATNTAVDQNLNVLMFSLEMSSGALVNRIVASINGINGQHLNIPNKLTDEEWDKYWNVSEKIEGKHLDIYDKADIKPSTIKKVIRKYKTKNRLDLLIVDYLQLMNSDNNYRGDKVQEIAEITRNLKLLAREFDIPVLLLSQINRNVESRTDKRPLLSDLKSSGSIEQDADVVMLLYREGYYNPDCETPEVTELIVAKNRSGPTDTVKLVFKGELTRFYSLQI